MTDVLNIGWAHLWLRGGRGNGQNQKLEQMLSHNLQTFTHPPTHKLHRCSFSFLAHSTCTNAIYTVYLDSIWIISRLLCHKHRRHFIQCAVNALINVMASHEAFVRSCVNYDITCLREREREKRETFLIHMPRPWSVKGLWNAELTCNEWQHWFAEIRCRGDGLRE